MEGGIGCVEIANHYIVFHFCQATWAWISQIQNIRNRSHNRTQVNFQAVSDL